MEIRQIKMVEDTKGLKTLRNIIRRKSEETKKDKPKKIKYRFNKR